MQERFAAACAGQRQCKTNHPPAVERAKYLPAGVVRHDKNCRRHRNMLTPCEEFQLYALIIFRQQLAMSHLDLVKHGRWMFRRCIHRVCATFAIFRALDSLLSSASFAKFHNSSLRSRGKSAKLRPSADAAASM